MLRMYINDEAADLWGEVGDLIFLLPQEKILLAMGIKVKLRL